VIYFLFCVGRDVIEVKIGAREMHPSKNAYTVNFKVGFWKKIGFSWCFGLSKVKKL